MRFVIEPKKFVNLLRHIMLGTSSGAQPVLEEVVIQANNKGLRVCDVSLGMVNIMAGFTPQYFLEYSCEGELLFKWRTSLLKVLKKMRGESVEVSVDKDKVEVRSIRTHYTEPLTVLTEPPTTIEMRPDEHGVFLPNVEVSESVKFVVRAEEFRDLMSGDTYTLRYDKTKSRFEITLSDVGTFTRILQPIRVLKDAEKNIELVVDGKMLRRILAQFDKGEVNVFLSPIIVVFQQKNNDYLLNYTMTGMVKAGEEVKEEAETKESDFIEEVIEDVE